MCNILWRVTEMSQQTFLAPPTVRAVSAKGSQRPKRLDSAEEELEKRAPSSSWASNSAALVFRRLDLLGGGSET